MGRESPSLSGADGSMKDLDWVEEFQLEVAAASQVDSVGIQIGTWDSLGRTVVADPDLVGVVKTDEGC